ASARSDIPPRTTRHTVCRLLVVITARKALAQLASERRKRRGGGTIQAESRISSQGRLSDNEAIEEIVGAEPTPEFAVQVAEQYERLLTLLDDETLRQVAIWKM